jgi:hypothetical protein
MYGTDNVLKFHGGFIIAVKKGKQEGKITFFVLFCPILSY